MGSNNLTRKQLSPPDELKQINSMNMSENKMINLLSSFNQILLIYTVLLVIISPLVDQSEGNHNIVEYEDEFIEEMLLDRAEPLHGFLTSVGILFVAGISSSMVNKLKLMCS